MQTKRILGINISDKVKAPEEVQYLLTKFGGIIRNRIGLSDTTNNEKGNKGLILLELTFDETECDKLEKELSMIDGLDVKKMVF